jgi:Tol biopolymer transport system component
MTATTPTTTAPTSGPTGPTTADTTMGTEPTGETADPSDTTDTDPTSDTTGPDVLGRFEDIEAIDVLNSEASDDDPSLRGDLLEIYFASTRDGTEDIFRATRASVDDAWGAPESVVELNTPVSGESTPEISADGLTLYFSSNRAAGQGQLDIYLATRDNTSDPWDDITPVMSLNTETGEGALVLTQDRLGGYLCRGEIGQGPQLFSAVREDLRGDWTATPIDALNTMNDDCSPFPSAGDSELWFGSIREGGVGGLDIWVSSIDGDDFGEPELVPELATPGGDDDPWLSEDGTVIVFASDRDGSFDLFTGVRSLQ